MSKIVARIWWCEDDVCNCYEPQIDRVRPRSYGFLTLYDREPLWRGTFRSDPTLEEMESLLKEITVKAKEYGIEVDKHGFGNKEVRNES